MLWISSCNVGSSNNSPLPPPSPPLACTIKAEHPRPYYLIIAAVAQSMCDTNAITKEQGRMEPVETSSWCLCERAGPDSVAAQDTILTLKLAIVRRDDVRDGRLWVLVQGCWLEIKVTY